MDLDAITAALIDETFDAERIGATPDLPADRIEVALTVDDYPEPLTMQIMVIPKVGEEDATPGLEMIQYFVPIPVEVEDPAVEDTIRRVLPTVNLNLSLGSFNYHEMEKFIFLRYVLLTSDDLAQSRAAITEAAWLLFFALESFAVEMVLLAEGGISADEYLSED